MWKMLLATIPLAVLAAGPALANQGRIACQNEVRDVRQWVQANPQAAQRVAQLEDYLLVAAVQCQGAMSGVAGATLVSIRQQLGMPSVGPQYAYEPDFTEWPDFYD